MTGAQRPGRNDSLHGGQPLTAGGDRSIGASGELLAPTQTAETPQEVNWQRNSGQASPGRVGIRSTRTPKTGKTASEANQPLPCPSHVSGALPACPLGRPKPLATHSVAFAQHQPCPRVHLNSPPPGGTPTLSCGCRAQPRGCGCCSETSRPPSGGGGGQQHGPVDP